MEKWNLPQGMTLEELDEYVQRKERERRREWNHKNPEKVRAQRITTSVNFLRRNGYTVVAKLPAPPWDELQEKFILQALRTNYEQEGKAQ